MARAIDAVTPSWPPTQMPAMIATSSSWLIVSPALRMISDRKSSSSAARRSAISCSMNGVSASAAATAASSHPAGCIEIGIGSAPRSAAHARMLSRSAMSRLQARQMTTAGRGRKMVSIRSSSPSGPADAKASSTTSAAHWSTSSGGSTIHETWIDWLMCSWASPSTSLMNARASRPRASSRPPAVWSAQGVPTTLVTTSGERSAVRIAW